MGQTIDDSALNTLFREARTYMTSYCPNTQLRRIRPETAPPHQDVHSHEGLRRHI
jgi:hypothetical protein